MTSSTDVLDRGLEEDVADLLHHDRRLAHLDVEVRVRGAVVHLRGTVPTEGERWLLRRLVGRLRKVQAVWDLVGVVSRPPLRVVDLGCGRRCQCPEAIGIDRVASPATDLAADLEVGLPLASDSVDHLFAVHVIEHVHDLVTLMDEIHRVLRSEGVAHLMVPHWRHANAIADPTHVRSFGPETFEWFCQDHPGAPCFQPLAVSTSEDTVLVDLRPVAAGDAPGAEVLARFFG